MEDATLTLLMSKLDDLHSDTCLRFDAINARLDKLNGKVDRHDKLINDLEKSELSHVINCPVNPKLRAIEDKILTQLTIKRFVVYVITTGVALAGVIVGIAKMFES